GYEQFRGRHGKRAVESRGGDAYDGRQLSVQTDAPPDGFGRGVHAAFPEAIADDDRRCITRLIHFRTKDSARLRLNSNQREVIGRYQVSEDALWFATASGSFIAERNVERHRILKRRRAGEQAVLSAKLLDIIVRDCTLRDYEVVGRL